MILHSQEVLPMTQTIAILGASPDPSRNSNRACRVLQNFGHNLYAVSFRRQFASHPPGESSNDCNRAPNSAVNRAGHV